MLVVTRFPAGPGALPSAFVSLARDALQALAEQSGYVRGWLGRAADDPARWLLVTEWASVGDYRRALSSYAVKVHASPLLALAIPEPSAYEVLLSGGSTDWIERDSDRAPEPAELPVDSSSARPEVR